MRFKCTGDRGYIRFVDERSWETAVKRRLERSDEPKHNHPFHSMSRSRIAKECNPRRAATLRVVIEYRIGQSLDSAGIARGMWKL
ncbi:hypothetical protein CFIMG_007995RA00001 [Ceratocystis fimbriata CBS 114723]|uniref:Uncharacterized protein n=1 Tax=Ceratocystis fimbriata CBS 114723 TaxID=1035309 RepID=A0A2C5XAI2_9PEZI|nr:hypothetical protein CFIMG_007995RA00001 [Ceratocystis fimbriata CBS 114723]